MIPELEATPMPDAEVIQTTEQDIEALRASQVFADVIALLERSVAAIKSRA